ncbi:MAG: LysR family transcriptional regulator [Moritella sp.]|uniref:LysR family transcriptional regulator n=1 Tax=Moritella sp. TaxID=78556 RepID=UPI00216D7269|nr:LysR family transcriptional regulator [Moritella sp.]MBL1416663.1 LysR family transcriptional regulator [Moritella sp.]
MRHSDLEAFLAVAHTRNFRRAAKDRGVTGSALSQTVRNLEEDLQVRLFNRTTRSVSLTEAGELLAERLLPAFDDIRNVVEEVRSLGGRPTGRVRINAPAPAVEWLIAPHVAAFLEAYPNISLEIIEDAKKVDIVEDGFDAGIRMGLNVAQDMISVPFGKQLTYPIVAAPAYLDRFGTPEDPHALTHHNCIRHRFPNGTIFPWNFCKNGQEITVIPEGRLTMNDPHHAVRVAVDGVGLARIAAPYVAEDLAEKRLVKVLMDWNPTLPEWHLYYPSRRHVPPALRAFLIFFRAAVV